jgi:tripartite-type tricarboxylate transporter receptor subunit TctC
MFFYKKIYNRRKPHRRTAPVIRRLALAGLASLALCSLAPPALAQGNYPHRPIRLVVPFAPGGGSDVAGRLAAQCMAPKLGQTVVVENRAGAGGTIGMEAVAKAPADGYTLAFLTTSSAVLNVFLYPKLNFDIRRDFQTVGEVGRSPSVLAVRRGLATDVAGLRAAGGRSGGLTYGSGGNGTVPHLAGTMLGQALGVETTHVPLRGAGPALTAVVAGQVDVLLESVPVMLGQIQEGLARALAVASPRRDPLLPHVPTTTEAGLPGFEIENWYGLFAPARVPAPIVETLARALREGLAEPACQARMRDLGLSGGTSDPAAFRAYWQAELDRWGPIVAASGARVD